MIQQQGIVYRIYNSLYDVRNHEEQVVCSKKKTLPTLMVGDMVDYVKHDGACNIIAVQARKNELLQPAVANIDFMYVMIAAKDPDYRLELLDQVLMLYPDIPLKILVNKMDLVHGDEIRPIQQYTHDGYSVVHLTARKLDPKIRQQLLYEMTDKTVVLAGQSGVGKSTLLRELSGENDIVTSEVSQKIRRGKQTTKQVALYYLPATNTYIMDSPGFSRIDQDRIEEHHVLAYYKELQSFLGQCKFNDCRHMSEPGCAVKQAVNAGQITSYRYDAYQKLVAQLEKNRKK